MSLLNALWTTFLIFAVVGIIMVFLLWFLTRLPGKARANETREEARARLLAAVEVTSRQIVKADQKFPGLMQEIFDAARVRHEQQLASVEKLEDALGGTPDEQ